MKSPDVQKEAVRMKMVLLILIASASLLQGTSIAGSPDDSTNGNRIPEPALRDYVRAERTPGFSPITDIRDEDGKPVRE